MELTGKTVLVTGASRGIGAAIARQAARDGARVIAHYGSHAAGAQEALHGVPDHMHHLLSVDLSVPGAATELWERAIEWAGRIDVVVLNAALNVETPFDGDEAIWDDGWDATMRVNVLEPARLVRLGLAHFLAHDGGIFIGLSSWSAQRGSAISTLPAYAASKAALKSVLQTVARNYAAKHVYSYILAPGIVKTRMADLAAAQRGGEEAVRMALEMRELVPPEEIGELVSWLATGRVRHLTGATIDINGASYIR